MNKKLKYFFWFCSGVNVPILKDCYTEHNKYASIGATVFLAGVLASFSGGYALFTVFQSIALSVFFGLLWGITIFNIDRFIVASMRKENNIRKELLISLPRFFIAILLAFIISKPIELRLFEREINYQMTEDNKKFAMEYSKQLNQNFLEIERIETKNLQLKEEIINKEKKRDLLYRQFIEEAEGVSGTGIVGKGPVFKDKKIHFDRIEKELNDLRRQNYSIIKENNDRINKLKVDKEKVMNEVSLAKENANGLLARLSSLGKLTGSNSTMKWTSWLIVGLFMLLEILPIMVKLLSDRGPYDMTFKRIENVVLIAEKKKISFLHDKMNTDMKINSEYNKNKSKMEIKANKEMIKLISKTQKIITEEKIKKWEKTELDKLRIQIADNSKLQSEIPVCEGD